MLQSENQAVPPHPVLYWRDLAVSARKAKRAGTVQEKSSPKDALVSTAASQETCREAQVRSFVLPWDELSVSSIPCCTSHSGQWTYQQSPHCLHRYLHTSTGRSACTGL